MAEVAARQPEGKHRVPSTATTGSASRHACQDRTGPDGIPLAALIIVIASAVAFVRVLAEIAVVATLAFGQMAPPLAIMFGWLTLISVGIYFLAPGEKSELPAQGNPAELKPALVFGGLYAVVILGVAAAKDYFGETGLYGVAILSGLHDLDAVTLSIGRLAAQGQVDPGLGWRLILTASLSNLVIKAGLVALLGPRRLLGWIALPFGAALLGGLVLLLWPTR